MSDEERRRARMGGGRARPDRTTGHDVTGTGERGTGSGQDLWSDTGTILVIDRDEMERRTARLSDRPVRLPTPRPPRRAAAAGTPEVRGVSPPSAPLPPIVQNTSPGAGRPAQIAVPPASHRETGDRYGVRPRFVPWSQQAIREGRYDAQRRAREHERERRRAWLRGRTFDPQAIPREELQEQERWVLGVMGRWDAAEFAALELSFTALDEESTTYAWTFYAWAWQILSRAQPRRLDSIRHELHQIRRRIDERQIQQREFRTDRNPRPDPYDPLGLQLQAPDPFAPLDTLSASALGSVAYALARVFGADNDTALRVAEAEAAVAGLAPAAAGAISRIRARRGRPSRRRSRRTPPVNPAGRFRGENRPGPIPELMDDNMRPSGLTANTGGIRRIRVHQDAEQQLVVTIDGELRRPLPRNGPATPNFNRMLPALDLPGYHIAHLWGPGFGDEAFDGMMYAPAHVNLVFQGALESRLRELHSLARRQGGTIELSARAVSHPLRTFRGHRLLRHASYHLSEVRLPDNTTQVIGEVDIWVPRPGASGGVVTKVTPGSSGVWSLM